MSIAGPRAAETSSWTALRVELKNTGQDPAQGARDADGPGWIGAAVGRGGRELLRHDDRRVRPDDRRREQRDARGPRPLGRHGQPVGRGEGAHGGRRVVGRGVRLVERERLPARPDGSAGVGGARGRELRRLGRARPLRHGPDARARALRCAATIATAATGGKTIASLTGKPTIDGSHLECSWRLPKSAHGRFVRALVLADTHAGGMQTRSPLVRRVR